MTVATARRETETSTTPTPAARAGKYLTFALAGEEYGLPVLKVREIITILNITAVPQAPAHVRGVINLRGKVIPVVDLRVTLGVASPPDDERTCIIVIDVALQTSHRLMGIVVDGVSEVLTITSGEIGAPPSSARTSRPSSRTGWRRSKAGCNSCSIWIEFSAPRRRGGTDVRWMAPSTTVSSSAEASRSIQHQSHPVILVLGR